MSGRVRFLDTRPLRSSRPFRDLWIGTSASQLGGQIANMAVLAQVWDLTGSPVGTGVIGLATGLPMVLFGLLGGTLADSVDRRAVVRATTAGQLLAAAGCAPRRWRTTEACCCCSPWSAPGRPAALSVLPPGAPSRSGCCRATR
ncbi:MFS transporter [Streptomyces sp. M10(2022)]